MWLRYWLAFQCLDLSIDQAVMKPCVFLFWAICTRTSEEAHNVCRSNDRVTDRLLTVSLSHTHQHTLAHYQTGIQPAHLLPYPTLCLSALNTTAQTNTRVDTQYLLCLSSAACYHNAISAHYASFVCFALSPRVTGPQLQLFQALSIKPLCQLIIMNITMTLEPLATETQIKEIPKVSWAKTTMRLLKMVSWHFQWQ